MDPNMRLKQLFTDYENGMIDKAAYRKMRNVIIDEYARNATEAGNVKELDTKGMFGSIQARESTRSRSSSRSLLFTFLLLIGAFVVYVYSTGIQR